MKERERKKERYTGEVFGANQQIERY